MACGDEVTQVIDSDELANLACTAIPLEDSTGMKIICGDDSVGVILNGQNGENGKNGTSCTAEALEDGTGIDIICGGVSVDTILNGVNGKDGKDGEKGDEGTACTVKESTFETLTVTCGETDYVLDLPGAKTNPELLKTYTRTIAFSTENHYDAIEFTIEELDSVKFQPTGKSFKFYADEFNFQIVNLGWVLHEKNITLTNLQSPYVKVSYKTDENSNYIFVTPDNILSSSSAQPTSSAPMPTMSEEYYVPSTATSTAEPKTVAIGIPQTMTALVDLRKETIAVVSIQTTYKYARIQNLLKAGVQIEEAIQQANNEFAEAITFGDEYENNNYGALDDFNVAKLDNKFGTDFFKEVVNQKVAYEFDEKNPLRYFL